MRFLKRYFDPLSALKRTPISVTTRTVDEILVISVTGAMTEKGGVDALLETATEAVQSSSGKILLELAPTYWDSNGLSVLGRVLDLVGTHQEKLICRLGPSGPLIGRGMIDTILARCDCSDSLDEAIKYLKEDC